MSDEKKAEAGELRGKYGVPVMIGGTIPRRFISLPTREELLRCVAAAGMTTVGGDIDG